MKKIIFIVVAVVAALLGSTTAAQAGATSPSCSTGGYTAMQDYVDTLVYWHRNPTWYPTWQPAV
jgi:hypothetical protein